MDRVQKEVHGLGPQWWPMDRGSMFCIIYPKLNEGKKEINVNNKPLCTGLLLSFAQRNKVRA